MNTHFKPNDRVIHTPIGESKERVNVVAQVGTKNGEPILIFFGASWDYASSCRLKPAEETGQ